MKWCHWALACQAELHKRIISELMYEKEGGELCKAASHIMVEAHANLYPPYRGKLWLHNSSRLNGMLWAITYRVSQKFVSMKVCQLICSHFGSEMKKKKNSIKRMCLRKEQTPAVKQSGGSMMLWSCFTSKHPGRLVTIHRIINYIT